MERSKAEAVIEAILFTMGDSVEIIRYSCVPSRICMNT